jgi:flagellar hook-length control protein FliK
VSGHFHSIAPGVNFVSPPAVAPSGGNKAANAPQTPLDVFAALLGAGDGPPEGQAVGDAVKTVVAGNDPEAAFNALVAGQHQEHGDGEGDGEGCKKKPHNTNETHNAHNSHNCHKPPDLPVGETPPVVDPPEVDPPVVVPPVVVPPVVVPPATEVPNMGRLKPTFAELIDSLRVLDLVFSRGEYPDAGLQRKVSNAINAFAAALGITFDPNASPADKLAALLGNATGQSQSETDLLDSLLEGMATLQANAQGSKPSADSVLARLANLMRTLAGKLHDPVMSPRMTALADRFSEGLTPQNVLTQLGFATPDSDPSIAMLTALLPPKTGSKAASTPPGTFVPPVLDTPDTGAFAPTKHADSAVASSPSSALGGDTDGDPENTPDIKIAQSDRPPITGGDATEHKAAPRTAPFRASDHPAPAATSTAASGDTALPAQSALTQTQTTAIGVDAAATKAVHAAYQTPHLNLPHFAFEIARQVQAGMSRFQIRLDPPELGRVDVRLDMDAGGNVNARMTVERSETLDLMQRDHRALERALAQAGLDMSKTNLEFSLKQNPFDHRGGEDSHRGHRFDGHRDAPVVAEASQNNSTQYYRGAAAPGGVNIFV